MYGGQSPSTPANVRKKLGNHANPAAFYLRVFMVQKLFFKPRRRERHEENPRLSTDTLSAVAIPILEAVLKVIYVTLKSWRSPLAPLKKGGKSSRVPLFTSVSEAMRDSAIAALSSRGFRGISNP
jgi:hypothetical protein